MALLSSGHLATDFANGALPALLPFLKERFSLSYTLVAALVLASQASSSLIQPLFGLLSDRRGALWLLPGGVALAGVGIALAAAADERAARCGASGPVPAPFPLPIRDMLGDCPPAWPERPWLWARPRRLWSDWRSSVTRPRPRGTR